MMVFGHEGLDSSTVDVSQNANVGDVWLLNVWCFWWNARFMELQDYKAPVVLNE